MVKKTKRIPAAPAEAAQAGPAAATTTPSEAAGRAAQDEEAGLDYDGDDGDDDDDDDDDDEEESSESEESDDHEGRRDMGDAMDLEVQGPQNAPDSDLTSLSAEELQELLYKEITRNVVRLREGLESLPLSAVALLRLKTQEAAIAPTRDVSAASQLARTSKQTVKMRPVAPQQQQRTRRPKKGKKDRGEKNEMGFRSDGSFDPCTHPTCRNHQTHPLERCWVKQKEEDGKAGKPAHHHKKKRYRWVKERVSDSE